MREESVPEADSAWRAIVGPGPASARLIGIAAGAVAIFYPNITALALLWVIAFWAIFTGLLEIMVAVRLRREISNEWVLILSGLLSVAFGVLAVAMPSAGALSILWLIGAYAIAFGIMILTLAFRMKGLVSPFRAGSTKLA